jgi:hypothetical protein
VNLPNFFAELKQRNVYKVAIILGPLLGFLLFWCAASVARANSEHQPRPNDAGRYMLKEKLARIITTSPDVVQFSKDRKYEEAWIIKSSSARPLADEWKRYIDRDIDMLIVEYVWNSEDDDKRFVLTLF